MPVNNYSYSRDMGLLDSGSKCGAYKSVDAPAYSYCLSHYVMGWMLCWTLCWIPTLQPST